jgi:T5SS/PEP-CTERM-associated repeat protein
MMICALSRRNHSRSRLIQLALAAWLLADPTHSAADSLWDNVNGGVFNVASNWFGGVPGFFDVARFEITNSNVFQREYIVDFTNNPTNDQLVVEDDGVTFNLFETQIATAHNYTLRNQFVAAALGTVPGRSGDLTVTGGTLTLPFANGSDHADLEIAPVANASGSLTVRSGGLVAGSPDVLVGLNGTGTLDILNGGDVIADQTWVGFNSGSTGTATITGNDTSLLAERLSVGNQGHGTLSIMSGGQVHDTFALIGDDIGTGEVTVSGSGSQWVNSDSLVVGYRGTGTLSITGGGQVRSNRFASLGELDGAGTNTVTVDGANSQWIHTGDLDVGRRSPGTLTITAGGRVESGNATIGTFSGAIDSAAIVSGTDLNGIGSQWMNTGSLVVGDGTDATLSITGGGSVLSEGGILGRDSNAKGTVNVSGDFSTWFSFSGLTIGGEGEGRLNVMDGGGVFWVGSAVIGSALTSDGRVTIDGPETSWNGGRLVVGSGGFGSLEISGGAEVHCGDAELAFNSGSVGFVTVAGTGSRWTITGDLFFGAPQTASVVEIQTGGIVTVAESTHFPSGGAIRLQGGTFRTSEIFFGEGGGEANFVWTSGTLHVGTYHGNLTNPNGGILAPGNSAGSTTVTGNYNQSNSGATLAIEIGGVTQFTQYDALIVQGSTVLGGNLQLTMLNGFVPTAANTFTILQSTGPLTGAFANVANGQRLATGLGSFVVNYGPGSPFGAQQVVLSVFDPTLLAGDYNHNGVVDAADYIIWRKTLGQTGTGLAADGNGNNQVDSGDYTFWRARFGRTSGAGAGASSAANLAVPEPFSASLCFLGLLLIIWRRR